MKRSWAIGAVCVVVAILAGILFSTLGHAPPPAPRSVTLARDTWTPPRPPAAPAPAAVAPAATPPAIAAAPPHEEASARRAMLRHARYGQAPGNDARAALVARDPACARLREYRATPDEGPGAHYAECASGRPFLVVEDRQGNVLVQPWSTLAEHPTLDAKPDKLRDARPGAEPYPDD